MAEKTAGLPQDYLTRALESAPEQLWQLAKGLPEEALSWHPAAGEWCLQEVLGHLIEAEQRGFAGRISDILGGASRLSEWDQEAVAASRADCQKRFSALMDEFVRLRSGSLGLVTNLSASGLDLSAEHPTIGPVTVAALLQEWVYHDAAHLKQALGNVQSLVWPAMGATQKFYE